MLLTGALLADPRTREQMMNPQGPIHKVLPGIPGITQGIFPGPTTAPINQLPYAMQDGIGRNPLGGPSIADPRTRQQQMQDSQNLIGGLVGSVANLPGVRQTPLRFAGDLVSTLLNSGALNPYNHVRY